MFEKTNHAQNEELINISQILALRLEGRSPICGIHLLLNRGGFRHDSVGYISELLNSVGSKLPSQLKLPEGFSKFQIVFASDEICSNSKPILVTLDPIPISSVILRMEIVENRTAERWEEHWTHLLDEGITPILLTNDEGTAMGKAQKSVLPDTPRQSDTFHAVAFRLGDIVRKLHKKIYKAIEDEYGRERVWENAKSELRGKRKGYSPIELLTGKKQEQDWLVTLLKEVKIST